VNKGWKNLEEQSRECADSCKWSIKMDWWGEGRRRRSSEEEKNYRQSLKFLGDYINGYDQNAGGNMANKTILTRSGGIRN
jgi:hypothetical protein